eukprot:556457-Amphidinium_carterae.1
METLRPPGEEASKQLGLSCGALIFEKLASLRAKVPKDKWNESTLLTKHSPYLSPVAHANGQFDWKESTLNRVWAGAEKA